MSLRPYPHYCSAVNRLIGRTSLPFGIVRDTPTYIAAEGIRRHVGPARMSLELDNDLTTWTTDGAPERWKVEVFVVRTEQEFLGWVISRTRSGEHVRSWGIPANLED